MWTEVVLLFILCPLQKNYFYVDWGIFSETNPERFLKEHKRTLLIEVTFSC